MKIALLARRRAALILQVRSGRLSASAAARHLGVSRKTYYQYEQRALQGMLQALQPGVPGRPRSQPAPELISLRHQLEQLEQELLTTRQRAHLRLIVRELHQPQPTLKKGRSSRRSSP